MKTNTESFTRDDLMGITMAVLMFVLQACMVFSMSTDVAAAAPAGMHSTMIAAHADAMHRPRPA